MGPDRHAAPFPFFDDVGHSIMDQAANMPQHLAAPVRQFANPSVDQFRRSGSISHDQPHRAEVIVILSS
jgi:hypothetical protein